MRTEAELARMKVATAERFYQARDTLRSLWGEQYAAKIAPVRQLARELTFGFGCDIVMLPVEMEKRGGEPLGTMFLCSLLAAIVDEVDGG